MTREEAIQKLVKIAKSQIGVKEVGGNNQGKKIREYQSAVALDPGPWAWCAAFTAWCMREWLKDPEVVKLMCGSLTAEKWRFKDARAYAWETWGPKHGATLLKETDLAKAGDIITYDFSHVGIVLEDQKPGDKFLTTCEGNTNKKGERDSDSGDGVWRKQRHHTLTKTLIRL